MADFALIKSSKLISRKIWVIDKSWNFHTGEVLTLTWQNLTKFLQAFKKKLVNWLMLTQFEFWSLNKPFGKSLQNISHIFHVGHPVFTGCMTSIPLSKVKELGTNAGLFITLVSRRVTLTSFPTLISVCLHFTMLQKLSKCEVKAWFCWNVIILQPLWFYVKSNFGAFKLSKNVIFGNFRDSEFYFFGKFGTWKLLKFTRIKIQSL